MVQINKAGVPVSSASQISTSARTNGRRQWTLAFLGFFLVFSAWAYAAPYDGPPDEVQHAIRAAGVVSGQIAPAPTHVQWGRGNAGTGAVQRVPGGLLHPATCWGFEPGKSAACAVPVSGGPVEDVPTSAGRYNPVYYLAVGAPLRVWPGWFGLVFSRTISAGLSAALLACAFVALIRWSRHGLMLAGLITATSPMLAHLAGAVNPNGLEIAAGIGLFSAAIPLLLGPVGGADRALASTMSSTPLVWLAGVSAALLATVRSLGPLWLLAGLFALLVPQSRAALRQLWSRPLVRRFTAVVVASLAFAVAWILIMKTGEVVSARNGGYHYGVGQAALMYFQNWEIYLMGMVGVAGWFDIRMPTPFYLAWICSTASLVLFALVVGTRAERWRFLVIFGGGLVVPGVLQVSQANVTGFIIGGRYMMPLMVAAPLLGAFILERRLMGAGPSQSLVRLFCLLLLPIHLVLLVYAMVRWQRGAAINPGISHLNPLTGEWHPPSGSVTPLVIMLAGLAVLGWTFWRGPAVVAALRDPANVSGEEPASSAPASSGKEPEIETQAREAKGDRMPQNGRRPLPDRISSGTPGPPRPPATSGRPAGDH
jgi:hypothetical protein